MQIDNQFTWFSCLFRVQVKARLTVSAAGAEVPVYATVELLTPTQKVAADFTNVALKQAQMFHYKLQQEI